MVHIWRFQIIFLFKLRHHVFSIHHSEYFFEREVAVFFEIDAAQEVAELGYFVGFEPSIDIHDTALFSRERNA